MTPPGFRSLTLSDVSARSISREFESRGRDVETLLHIAPTSSLERSLGACGFPALMIQDLIDVIVWAGKSPDLHVSTELFPAAVGTVGSADRRAWRGMISGKRISERMRVHRHMRDVIGELDLDRRLRSMLRRQVPQLATSLEFLVESGLHPDAVQPTSEVAENAAAIWRSVEQECPDFASARRDLWGCRPDEPVNASQPVVERVQQALAHITGREGPVELVHHGFYFFSPLQWAMFQTLRDSECADQTFVIHDDGHSSAFETWRRYFREAWTMPQPFSDRSATEPGLASPLTQALGGEKVVPTEGEGGVQIRRYDNIAEFARGLLHESNPYGGVNGDGGRLFRYSPNHTEINRVTARLSSAASPVEPALADLPAGRYLLALIRCVSVDGDGAVSLTLDPATFMQLADTGLLSDLSADVVARLNPVMPYFDDLTLIGASTDDEMSWLGRAQQLRKLVESSVARLDKPADSSLASRQNRYVENPLRLLPWCDLDRNDALALQSALVKLSKNLHDLVSKVAQDPRLAIRNLTRELEKSLVAIDDVAAAEVKAKLISLTGSADQQADVEAVIEALVLLLGHGMEHVDDEDGRFEPVEHATAPQAFKPLRGVDELALAPPIRGDVVHVANLSSQSFPSSYQPVRWPFVFEDLKSDVIGLEILATRASTTALSDLYQFQLMLNAAATGAEVVLSWISEIGGQKMLQSSFLDLIGTLNSDRQPHLAHAVGGVKSQPAGIPTHYVADAAEQVADARDDYDEKALSAAMSSLPLTVQATAALCPRRFALQWVHGPSASFVEPILQHRLIGLLQQWVQRQAEHGSAQVDPNAIADGLPPHLTNGQTASSVRAARLRSGVRESWKFLLKGSMSGNDEFSRAYQIAEGKTPLNPSWDAAFWDGYLPAANFEDGEPCKVCAVRSICTQVRSSR